MGDYLNNLLLEVCNDDDMYTIQTKQYLAQRKIILNDIVDEDIVRNVTLNIFQWNKEDKDIPIEKKKTDMVISQFSGWRCYRGIECY